MANRQTTITNRDLYDSLDRIRTEFGGAINRLDDKFTALEAGRLTALERRMNDFVIAQAARDAKYQEAQATLSTKFVIIGAIALAILYGLVDAFARKVIR